MGQIEFKGITMNLSIQTLEQTNDFIDNFFLNIFTNNLFYNLVNLKITNVKKMREKTNN